MERKKEKKMKPFIIGTLLGLLLGSLITIQFRKTETQYVNKTDTLLITKTVEVPKIVIKNIPYRMQLPQDENEPTTFKYQFDQDSIKFVVVLESQIEPIDIYVKDFEVQPPKFTFIDTIVNKTYIQSVDTIKSIAGYSGATVTGFYLGSQDYKTAIVVGSITFAIVYFWDEIERIWKWTQKLFM